MIPIIQDPDEENPPWYWERCCFCRQQTEYWTNLKRRKPGAQVACCMDCSLKYHQKDVPTKKDWCNKEEQIRYEQSNAYVRGEKNWLEYGTNISYPHRKQEDQQEDRQKVNDQLDELTNQLVLMRKIIDNILEIRQGNGTRDTKISKV